MFLPQAFLHVGQSFQVRHLVYRIYPAQYHGQPETKRKTVDRPVLPERVHDVGKQSRLSGHTVHQSAHICQHSLPAV